MLEAVENEEIPHKDDALGCLDPDSQRDRSSLESGGENVAEEISDSGLQLEEVDARKKETVCTVKKDDDLAGNKSPSSSIVGNDTDSAEVTQCAFGENSEIETQCSNSSQHNTTLGDSFPTRGDVSLFKDLHKDVDDTTCSAAMRCRVYERATKKLAANFRGFSESSLSVCGLNNLLVPYRCGENCDFSSVSLSALKIHYMLKHVGEDLFLCTLCSERFVCDDSLLEHICKYHYDHHKIVFECKVNDCSMPFQRLKNLRDHLHVGHKDCKLIPCSFCFCESCSAEDMMKHIRSHLKRTLRCAYCLLIFNSREEVIKHINASHVGFLRKLNLQVEVINHERRLKQKNFRNECLNEKHNITNLVPCNDGLIISPLTRPLPYQCRDCTYTCTNDNLLDIHIKEGHLENADITKDFSCNFCKFSTNDKDTIINHLSFHTNARFLRCYSCPYCPKESNCIDIIESHLLAQHPLASFKFEAGQENIGYLQDMVLCPLCKGTFKWKSRFCNHLSTKHNLKALADYLMLQCISDISKNSLILPKQFLTDKLDITLPVSLSRVSDDNQSNKVTSEEYVFKCIKCNFKNSNYNVYNDHVKSHYEAFDAEENGNTAPILKKENSMLFVCKLCPFQCNKSINFKRHSAIHERAKSLENCFKCGYCMFKHYRINCIKFHLGKYHERLPIKVVKITDCEEIDITESEFVKNNSLNHFEKVENSSTKKESSRVANEYFDSFLPRGMIFAEPVKCPNCDYANRVRINLIRHMRQHLYEDLVQIPKDKSTSQEASGNDRDGSLNSPSQYEYQRSVSEETFLSGDSSVQSFSGDGVTTKKLFKCAYCDVVSKWNRRDISLHILHVHLQKKVYTCSYCDYGSRKSSQMVMNHCSRVHPGKPIIIKDELALFNSVVPLRDGDGVVTVAYVKKNGAPILSLEELGSYLKLTVKKNKNDMTLAGNLDKDDEIVPSADKITVNEGFSQDVDEEIYSDNVDNSEEWKCKFCGLQMFSEVMMKRHVMCQHMKLKPYSCKYCKAQYWQKQSMENHMRSNHPDEDMYFIENAKEKVLLVNKYMQKLTNVHRIRQTPCKKYSSIYHCRICGYQDPRHDKAKYHVVKKHLKIGLYSCSKCHQYMGGKGCVENHIEEFHPGSDAYVCRSYDIHALFLQKNIRKISGFQSNKNSTQRNSLAAGRKSSLRIKSELETSNKQSQSKALLTCNHCSYVAESEASLGAHSRVHKVFACFYCDYQNNLVSRVQSHCLIRHPTKPIKHKQIAPLTARIQTEDLKRFTESPKAYDLDKADQEKVDFPNNLPPSDFSSERSTHSKAGLKCLYKCKLCSYNSDKATVIRHHIMSHLLYHPYQCPYCNLVCSVKSSAITRHIQLIHPDKEIRFICKRDEQMEKQVRNSFEKISLDPDGNITGIETASQISPIIKEQHFASNQRIYYKCCFCSLVTPIRTDMKHHLMRELKYKPFSCAYCQYEEPCKSKMGKHFRIKHPGMTISIKHSVNAKKELQIFDCLQKCMVKNDPKKIEKPPEKTGNIPIIRISNLQNVLISSLHYRGKFHKCSKCQYETSSIKAIISHRSVHDKFRLKCCFCCYANKNLFLLRRHMKKCYVRNCLLPANPKEVKSEWFKSLKRRVSKFVRNMRPVLKARCSKKLVCCYCNQGFPSTHLMQSHLKNSHLNTAKHKSRGLIRHKKEAEPSTTFCCNQCPLKFSALEDFGIHLQIHFVKKVTFPLLEVFPDEANSKYHQCGFCSFQTTKDDEFTAHVTTHTTLHPIKCKHCLFASFTSSDMKHHFEVNHPNQDVRFDSLTQPYTMMAQSSHVLPNFKPVVKLVDLKFCLS